MRIHPVVNVSWIVWYKKQVKGQKKKEGKPIEMQEVEECTAEGDIWEKKEDLKNAGEALEEFKGRLGLEVIGHTVTSVTI